MVNKLKSTLTPEQVAEKITFDASDANWRYQRATQSMAAKQAEGVAGLWNLLSKHQLALLADEVGMGKTYQALAVMLLLWQRKPNARILVMAPNQTLCTNWQKEFITFSGKHWRTADNPFTSPAGKEKYAPQIYTRLKELAAAVAEHRPCFTLTTIHALSGLLEGDEKEEPQKYARRHGASCRQQIVDALGRDGFDLIIIDEAHYLRNRDGHSQRAAAARAFFGENGARLASNALLLTATPNHSAPRNLYDIFSYFSDRVQRFDEQDVRGLMQHYGIRRLRKLQGKDRSYSKYEYRREQAVPASFDGQLSAELFFALYQKKLVQQQDKEGQKTGGRRFVYGYLEGFESTGSSASEPLQGGQDDEEAVHDDFSSAPDSHLLNQLTRQFNDIYHRFPDHPKYDALVEVCGSRDLFDTTLPLHSHKHLVFVRRIPSVREITQRINAQYDLMMAKKLMHAWGLSDKALRTWQEKNWSRQTFADLLKGKTDDASDLEDPLQQGEQEDDEPGLENDPKIASKIAELFVVRKTGLRRTDCTNVSLRFRRPESLFSLFLEPALDGQRAAYTFYYRKSSGDRTRDSYGDAAHDARQRQACSLTSVPYTHPLTTAWGMMFDLLPAQAQAQLQRWCDQADGQRIIDNFARYLRTGYLFASPVMIELYCWFTAFNRQYTEMDVQQRYRQFTAWVQPQLASSLMLRYFTAAITTFETLCEKIVSQELNNSDYPWRELTSLNSPGWFASGQSTNRERLIRGFNSPFFPNVLVATSVFQEGVNLHLQCHQVHHYGLAWTPGDNEQRTGRVDRLFGKVNELLLHEGKAELGIHYPYLAGSFDQDQLASFIRLKHQVEEKLDACDMQQADKTIHLDEDPRGWQAWLRQPETGKDQADPYPARFDDA